MSSEDDDNRILSPPPLSASTRAFADSIEIPPRSSISGDDLLECSSPNLSEIIEISEIDFGGKRKHLITT